MNGFVFLIVLAGLRSGGSSRVEDAIFAKARSVSFFTATECAEPRLRHAFMAVPAERRHVYAAAQMGRRTSGRIDSYSIPAGHISRAAIYRIGHDSPIAADRINFRSKTTS
jgi:hypothetical protein